MSQSVLERDFRNAAVAFVNRSREIELKKQAITAMQHEVSQLLTIRSDHENVLKTSVGRNIRQRVWIVDEYAVVAIWDDENTGPEGFSTVEAVRTEP